MANEVSHRNVLRRIEDHASNIAKDYTNLHLMPRGIPTFVDQSLRGSIRFAKRWGNILPVIAADNSSSLAANINPPTDSLVLTSVVSGMEIEDAVLTLGPGREFARVVDIDTTTGEVSTESELVGVHAEGEQVDLYGVPIDIISAWSLGVSTIQVRSAYKIVNGDQIAIDTTRGSLTSLVATLITQISYLGVALDGRFNYQLDLEEPISRSLVNEESILLRAQPGYESTLLNVQRLNGPFVVDYVSGPFFDDLVIEEYLSLQLLNPIGTALPGFDQLLEVGKNFAVANMPIKSESMLFWDVVQGTVQFKGDHFVAITDSNGCFVLSQELVPTFPPGTEWQIPVRSNGVALLRVAFLPNDYRDFSLSDGILNRVNVGSVNSDQDCSRIEVVLKSHEPYTEVEFFNWLPTEYSLASIIYQITSTAYGDNIWQAGSLMLKPYFFTLGDIKARHDFFGYDSGTVHF